MNLFIRKKTYNLLDKYDILDENGRLVYTADGLLVRPAGRLVMRDREELEILTLRKSANPFFANYSITTLEDPDEKFASMKQLFALRPTFHIEIAKTGYEVFGNLRACNFNIMCGTELYARIYKRDLRWGDTYILSIADSERMPIFCALTAALDNALY